VTIDGENIAERLMTELQLMSGRRLLVGGSESTANITNRIMRNNFYGTIDKVPAVPRAHLWRYLLSLFMGYFTCFSGRFAGEAGRHAV